MQIQKLIKQLSYVQQLAFKIESLRYIQTKGAIYLPMQGLIGDLDQ